MKKLVFIYLLAMSVVSHADECTTLGGSANGVPDEYHQLKCKAMVSFANRDYLAANEYFKHALALYFHESPNYNLYLELGHSQCLAGEKDIGLSSIAQFTLMAKADLGYFSCPTEEKAYEKAIQSEHMHLACEGSGSSLSEHGRVELEVLLILAKTYEKLCEKS